jgi:virulence-associated protein VagC
MLPVLEELKAIGVEVIPQGENLLIRPASKVPQELKERLRSHKAEVLAALKEQAAARPATCAASCYEIEPGRWIHHPWDGCQTPMPPTKPRQAAERACWHCQGARFCACSTCAQGLACDSSGRCVACHGRGKVWIQ